MANFGWTYSDYCQITPRQKALIMKAYENRYASFTMQVYNAVFTAEYNINRKKGRKALNPLRKIPKKADIEKLEVVVDTFNSIVSVRGRSWTEKILAANGLKKGGR